MNEAAAVNKLLALPELVLTAFFFRFREWIARRFGVGSQGGAQAEAEKDAPVVARIESGVFDDLNAWSDFESLGELQLLEKFQRILVSEIGAKGGAVRAVPV